MKKEQVIALTVSILCALALVLGAVVSIFMGSWEETPDGTHQNTHQTTQQTTETELSGEQGEQEAQPTIPEETEGKKPATEKEEKQDDGDEEEAVKPPPTDLPPTVEIPPETDPVTGQTETVKFPCTVPGYNLKLEKMAPYDGMFVENGTNVNVQQVAMLMVKNEGDYPIEYTQLAITVGEEQLLFDISALPKGETLVVQEKFGKTIPAGDVTAATALVVQRAEMEMSQDKIRVTDNGNNSITVENLTGETIPSTRVFYKYYMKEEGLFVGGIAFTVRIRNLSGGEKVVVQPAHYNSATGRVVMVQTYEN